MATPVIMPRQGQSVESCIIGQWHKQVGDAVAVGDELFSYETDKAAFDETAQVAGQMLAIFFAEGDDVPCLSTVCVIGAPGEDFAAFRPAEAASAAPAAGTMAAPEPAASPTAAVRAPSANSFADSLADSFGNSPADSPNAPSAAPLSSALPPASPTTSPADAPRLAISPRARALADKRRIDLRAVSPSGPGGRIVERDVRALIASGTRRSADATIQAATGAGSPEGRAATPAPLQAPGALGLPECEEEKHTHIRKLIARSMNFSLSTMAQLTYAASFDASEILGFRARLKKAREGGLDGIFDPALLAANITLNDIILYAVSRVILRHRACNAAYLEDRMVYYKHVNLGMAVDTPRGLMVPTIFRADRLSLAEISAQAKALAADCQKGTISPDRLKDGTFTVTNLGSLGIESFTPVINPPQTAILGVNCLQTRVRDANGVAVPYPSMSFSLTCDHRAVDGAPAARLLQDLKTALENFSLLLIKP